LLQYVAVNKLVAVVQMCVNYFMLTQCHYVWTALLLEKSRFSRTTGNLIPFDELLTSFT